MSFHPSILMLALLPFLFLFGLYFDSLSLKFMAFVTIAIASYLIMLVPFKWSLFGLFIYIGLEGFFKVVSNYHPVIHVGSDLLVIILCSKVLVKVFMEGMPKDNYPPYTKGFVIHFLWLAIVLFNPYALSVLSSIAGAKIYVTMFILYFFGYYLTESKKDVRFFMVPFVIVAVIHTVTGLLQGIYGPGFLLALHPRYAVQLAKYQHVAFRPFGMTNLPGGPSVYIYQIYPFLLYCFFYYRSYLLKLSLVLFLPLSTFLFFLCQVRSALLKMIVASCLFLLGLIHIFAGSSYRVTQKVVTLASVLGLVLYFSLPFFFEASVEARAENEDAIERSLSLFEIDRVSNARRGAFDRFFTYVQEVPFGAGLARVGASAGAFKELHKEDKIFGYKHFFSDNFWVTALVEVGIPGMLIITFLVLCILFRGYLCYFVSKDPDYKLLYLTLLSSLTALFIGLYGAEGLIYNPESCFFWFFAGVLMKLPELEVEEIAAQQL